MATSAFPHHYTVQALGAPEGPVTVRARGLPELATTPPPEFGGPEGHWSPETLLASAVADCFILTFRALARASNLPWRSLACDARATLDRADGRLRFTALALHARLVVPAGSDAARAERLLDKAERGCLVTASLACPTTLAAEVSLEGDATGPG